MLKVNKTFKPEYEKSKQWAVASSMVSSVMLDTIQTDTLKRSGLAREVINRIQRLRKNSGISIEDQIEVYYKFESEAELLKVINEHSDKVVQTTRMPFLADVENSKTGVFIGETEFTHPDNEKD